MVEKLPKLSRFYLENKEIWGEYLTIVSQLQTKNEVFFHFMFYWLLYVKEKNYDYFHPLVSVCHNNPCNFTKQNDHKTKYLFLKSDKKLELIMPNRVLHQKFNSLVTVFRCQKIWKTSNNTVLNVVSGTRRFLPLEPSVSDTGVADWGWGEIMRNLSPYTFSLVVN